MQLLLVTLCGFSLSLSYGAPATDFDNTRKGYEFIYHDVEDLLLVVHNNDCYFAHMPDRNVRWTQSSSMKAKAEDVIVNYIEGKAPHSRQENDRNNDNDESEEDEGDSREAGSVERRSTSHSSSPQFLSKEKSLAEMRDLFQDRLADFHCLQKNVYEVELQSDFWRGSENSHHHGDDDDDDDDDDDK